LTLLRTTALKYFGVIQEKFLVLLTRRVQLIGDQTRRVEPHRSVRRLIDQGALNYITVPLRMIDQGALNDLTVPLVG
jgi:hypothetical protein